MTDRAIWAVLDIPPNSRYPNGFSPRYEAFLSAVRANQALEIFAVRRGDTPWKTDEFIGDTLFGVPVTFEEAGCNPLNAAGVVGRARRFLHYCGGRLPHMCHPARFAELEKRLASELPAAVISFLPSTAQVAARVPAGVPVISVLEEAYDRMLPDLSGRRGRKAWAARREARKLQDFYRMLGERSRATVAISNREVDWFSRFMPRENVVCIPHAIDCQFFRGEAEPPDFDIAIFGNLSYANNYEPARRLFDRVAGMAGSSTLKWAFVGHRPHDSIMEIAGDHVKVTGYVPDLRPWYSRARVVAVPTLSGAGVKTTVLQAWAMGKPVVATPFAANGIDCESGREILIGCDEEEMARHVLDLVANPSVAHSIGTNARAAARANYDIDVRSGEFADLCWAVSGLKPRRSQRMAKPPW